MFAGSAPTHNGNQIGPAGFAFSIRKMSPRTLTFTNRRGKITSWGLKAQTQHKGGFGMRKASQVVTNSQVSTRTWTGNTMFFMGHGALLAM